MNILLKKVPPYAMPKLQRFLNNFKTVFKRSNTMSSAERYTTGLLSDIPYKNCGMISEFLEGTSMQALQQFITDSKWDHEELNKQRVKHMVENALKGDGAIIFDDTGFPKDGNCSVGVARQYSGTLGKVGNCQIAVSCQYTDNLYTWPIHARLYLPEKWTQDEVRLKKAKVPENITFKTKVQIALDLLDAANNWGVKHSVVLADCFYGQDPTFLEGLESRKEAYAVSVPGDFSVKFQVNENEPKPQLSPPYKVSYLMGKLSEEQWETIGWRNGSKGPLKKQFAFIRARWATRSKFGDLGFVIFERPVPGDTGDVKYYFSNLPAETSKLKLAEYVHRRHTIENFYKDAKDELGLDQYEGRFWHGFHRHVSMVMLAYSWLTLQRKVQHAVNHQYEILEDGSVVQSPTFNAREFFSLQAICDE